MADLALVTANRVSVVDGVHQDQYTLIAGEAITAGAPVYIDATTGKALNADASAAGTADVFGIAIKTVASGEPVTVVHNGVLDGYALSGMSYGEAAYLSNNAGLLADAVGTVTVRVGTVIPALANSISNAYDRVLKVERSTTPS